MTHSTNMVYQVLFWSPDTEGWGQSLSLSLSFMEPCDLTFCSTRGNILLLIVIGLFLCVKNEESKPQSYTPCSMALTIIFLNSFTEI